MVSEAAQKRCSQEEEEADMSEVLIFGGTTEGRELAEFCEEQHIPAVVSVATGYGREVLAGLREVRVLEGRLSESEIEQILCSGRYTLVLDATHPYAAAVTEAIQRACAASAVPLLRVLRDSAGSTDNRNFKEHLSYTGGSEGTDGTEGMDMSENAENLVIQVPTAEAAADFLTGREGNILLTTGSKELGAFEKLSRERLFVRVLPGEEALKLCRTAGIIPAHIAALQGPFSEEMNMALLRHYHCRWLVTKESGERGGFSEKLAACRGVGARAIVIGRPKKEKGISEAEAKRFLRERFGVQIDFSVSVCGIGPGGTALMTEEVKNAVEHAELLIGAVRMVETGQRHRKAAGLSAAEVLVSWNAEEIAARIQKEYSANSRKGIAVLVSGDSGFYSGSAGVLRALEQCAVPAVSVRCCPGISSLSYLAARVGLPWEGTSCLSLHGRRQNWLSELRRCGSVFLTLEKAEQMAEIAALLCGQGLGSCSLILGKNLSLANEKIIRRKAEEWCAAEITELTEDTRSVEEAQQAEDTRSVEEAQQAEGVRSAEGTQQAEDSRPAEEPGETEKGNVGKNAEGKRHLSSLCAAMLRLPDGEIKPLHPGIPDSCFLRERVPLTKAAVRAEIMAMLHPGRSSVCWDIGSGSGGVTAELSMAAPTGTVFAVECDEAAYALTKKNIRHLGLWNVVQLRGEAPELLDGLPAPDCVFIGGSSGKLREILAQIYQKNAAAVTAVTAITLETAAELFQLLKEYESAGCETRCVQLSAAEAQKRGRYSLLTAQNPVYLAVIRGGGKQV